jgi:hypothetical protein
VRRAFAGALLLWGAGIGLYGQVTADPLIERARGFAEDYSRTLPDYVVTRDTSRYTGQKPALTGIGTAGNWLLRDRISGELTVRNASESYANLRRDGKPISGLPPGVWSSGEFASELMAVLAPARNATFKTGRAESLRNRQVKRYSFSVDQRHSAWVLTTKNIPGSNDVSGFACAYQGTIWIDVATGKTLQVEMSAKDLPIRSPLLGVHSQTDYDFVDIEGTQYVLPTRSEAISCERRTGVCFRNESEFHGYKKFQVKSQMTFEKGR